VSTREKSACKKATSKQWTYLLAPQSSNSIEKIPSPISTKSVRLASLTSPILFSIVLFEKSNGLQEGNDSAARFCRVDAGFCDGCCLEISPNLGINNRRNTERVLEPFNVCLMLHPLDLSRFVASNLKANHKNLVRRVNKNGHDQKQRTDEKFDGQKAGCWEAFHGKFPTIFGFLGSGNGVCKTVALVFELEGFLQLVVEHHGCLIALPRFETLL